MTLRPEKDVELFPAWSQDKKQLYLECAFAQFCLSQPCSFFKVRIFREAFLIPRVRYRILCFFDISSTTEPCNTSFSCIPLTYSFVNSLRPGTLSSPHSCVFVSCQVHWLVDEQPLGVPIGFYLCIGSLVLWRTNL